MSLAGGSRIGPYEVIGALGAGGMGEVYRARDARLQRDVALKVLPAHFLADPERLARFEREARLLASLNHPHIAAIYGIEDDRSGPAHAPVLVLELVEGDALDARVGRGPVPVDEAIGIALQIAEALEAAHERGIVHRDLKPANVKLSADGQVKVLDFGLAKALEAEPSGTGVDPAMSPTFTARATALGVVMGTAAYMSPEQARGKAVDRRADIWAFGALLYELLTGTRAFPGETVSDALASVLKGEPDWSRLPRNTPASVTALIRRCLERDVRLRLQAIGEARIALAAPDRAPAGPADSSTRRRTAPLWIGAAAGAIVLSAAAGWWVGTRGRTESPVRKLDLAIDGLEGDTDRPPMLSPDGRRILYSVGDQLWVRPADQFAAKAVAGTEGGRYPFWSPDGQQIAFVRDGKVWKAAVDGTEASPVGSVPLDTAGSAGGVWTSRGTIVVAGSDNVGLFEIPLEGGAGREILRLDPKTETDFHEVSQLPQNGGLVFTVHRLEGADTIAVFADGRRRDVFQLPGETLRAPVYAPPGYLLYTRETAGSGVYAVPFSLEKLETTGEPFLVTAGARWPSVGQDGTLAVLRESGQPSQLMWFDRKGSMSRAGDLPGRLADTLSWRSVEPAPDGRHVAFALAGPSGMDVWSYDIDRRSVTRLSLDAGLVISPTWTADGQRVLFGGFRGNRKLDIYAVPAHEARTPEQILKGAEAFRWPCTVSPDGKWLVYGERVGGHAELHLAPLDGSAPGRPLMSTPFAEDDAKFSPDGKWLAYTSNESGPTELYVRAFPIGSERLQVSTGGGTMPAWSSDGTELFYRSGEALISARLEASGSRLEVVGREILFAAPNREFSAAFMVARDAQHFLLVRSGGADRIGLILNWAVEFAGGPTGTR